MLALRSMTGFGTAEAVNPNLSIKIEIRSLNGKFFEITPRIHKLFRDKETEIRQWAMQKIGRGSVQIYLHAESHNNDLIAQQFSLDHNIALLYKSKIDALSHTLSLPSDNLLEYILQLPEVSKTAEIAAGEDDWLMAKQCLEEAFLAFDAFRLQEGKALAKHLQSLIAIIRTKLKQIQAMDEERKQFVRNKIEKALSDLEEKVQKDPTRFEYELLYYLEKIDIQEEISRLGNHLAYFEEVLLQDASGKKLGFISQEIGREINTIGSKANYFPMQKFVVEMKDELEKIKEQILNVV